MLDVRKLAFLIALVPLSIGSVTGGQGRSPSDSAPLVLIGAIPLPNVLGRIDHIAIDPKARLFVSALGNNSEEVIDIAAGIRSGTIASIPNPQGVVYVPELNKLFVGSDSGRLYVYDGKSFDLLTSIDFGDDVDNLRYDPGTKRVYVGYGDEDGGAIGEVDATTNKRIDQDFKLGAHPESFQLEKSGPHVYVNLPELKQVADINRATGVISRWTISEESNFPMALDESDHRIFVVTRAPARLVVLDANSGREVAALACVQNSDDIFFDAARKRIYIPGGEGYISVFQQKDADHYESLPRVPSAIGGRTAAYSGKGRKGLDYFYLAVPASAAQSAELLIYAVQD
jgi:DNA-binding beta-propeller fold protein YncE